MEGVRELRDDSDEKDRIDQAADNTVEGGVKLEGKAKENKSEKEGRWRKGV